MEQLFDLFIILLPVILLIYFWILLIKVKRNRTRRIINKYGEQNVILSSSNVNYIGKKSAGIKQIKGNGILLLTKKELYFEMWYPKEVIKIPLSSIKNIENSRTIGKTKISKLLKINYINQNNTNDSCAWLVRKREVWQKKLENLIGENNQQ